MVCLSVQQHADWSSSSVPPPASVTLLLLAACLTCWPQHTAARRASSTTSQLRAAGSRCRLTPSLHPADPGGHKHQPARTPHASCQSAASLCCCGLCGDGIVLLQHLNGLLNLCVGGQAKQQQQLRVKRSVTRQNHCCAALWCVCCFVVRVLFRCACSLYLLAMQPGHCSTCAAEARCLF